MVTYQFPSIEIPLGSMFLLDSHILQYVLYGLMLVHCDIARLPVRDECDDGVGTPNVLDVEGDPSVLKEVINDDEPCLQEVHGSAESDTVRVILHQVETERYTKPAEWEISGSLDGDASGIEAARQDGSWKHFSKAAFLLARMRM